MRDEAVLVLDVGTSTSAAVLVAGDTVRLVKEPSGESWVWPSVVAWDGTQLLVGRRAEHRRPSRPEIARTEFKRELGTTAPLRLGDADFLPERLIAALIEAVRNEAERLHGAPITRAVLTCPASYRAGDPRRDLLITAGEMAGFTVVDLLPEPVAAALAPVAGPPLGAGDTVLVYDFGGGTFDAAVVRIAGDSRHEVLGHAALDDCGGRDIDVLVRRELLALAGTPLSEWLEADGSATAKARNEVALAEFAVSVKRRLSDEEEVETRFAPADLILEVRRESLTKVADPLLVSTVACCRELLDRCGLRADDLAAVLLTGGTTRMHAVAAAVTQAFGERVRRVEDPELAVAQGAAAWTRAGTDRFSVPTPPGPESMPMSWEVPGGVGTILRWQVAPGADVAADTTLALLRLADGGLWELRGPGHALRVQRLHAGAGQRISAGDWLVTAGPPGRPARRVAARRPVLAPPERVYEIPAGVARLDPSGGHVAVRTPGVLRQLRLVDRAVSMWTAEVAGTGHHAYAPGGERLAVWAHDPAQGVRNTMVVLDGGSGADVARTALETHGLPVNSALFPPFFAGLDTVIALTVYSNPPLSWRLTEGAAPVCRRLDGMSHHQPFAASPDGELVINAERLLVELRNGATVATIGDTAANLFAWAPGGTRLVTSHAGVARLWDVRSGREIREYPTTVRTHVAMRVSPDERLLAAATDDGQVWVWQLDTGALVERMLHQAPTNADQAGPDERVALAPVQDLVFTPDSQGIMLATERTVAVWTLGGSGG